MKVKRLGHATFLINSDSGVRIITDPYKPDERLKYGEINEAADVVTVSHEHGDHNYVAAVQGDPEIVRETAKVKEIEFKGILTYHDNDEGKQRGKNTVFCFRVDGVGVCHLGDLGHPLSDSQVAELGSVDVLLIPVGGFYTIDTRVAGQVCEQLRPKVVIPMHFGNDKCSFPIAGVDDFLKGKRDVIRPDASEVEFKRGELPEITRITVLKPAL